MMNFSIFPRFSGDVLRFDPHKPRNTSPFTSALLTGSGSKQVPSGTSDVVDLASRRPQVFNSFGELSEAVRVMFSSPEFIRALLLDNLPPDITADALAETFADASSEELAELGQLFGLPEGTTPQALAEAILKARQEHPDA